MQNTVKIEIISGGCMILTNVPKLTLPACRIAKTIKD